MLGKYFIDQTQTSEKCCNPCAQTIALSKGGNTNYLSP